MSKHMGFTRRTVLSAMAYLGMTPAVGLADDQVSGELWQPEALGERVWLAWRAEDVPPGPVTTWTDRAGGVVAEQTDPELQPQKLPSGEIEFVGGTKNLVIPRQKRAFMAHRAVMMLFRADLDSPTTSNGTLFHINGLGGPFTRQPAIAYSTDEVDVQWRDPSSPNSNGFGDLGDASDWHCIVSRRVDGVHFASLDGRPEIATGTEICLGRNKTREKGLIGDHRPRTISWAVDCIYLLQDELTQEDAEKLMGWAMWKRGVQSRLPDNHPYRDRPPLWNAADQEPPFVESSPQEWSAIEAFWDDENINSELQQAFRTPLDLAGYDMVFEDHFTSMSITDEVTGTGPWWSPVHNAATGKARTGRVDDDPPVFLQSGSELTIRMQKDDRGWSSGVFTSVNLNGKGNTWKYGYFECRARATAGNGFAAWPAFWVKSVNEFFRLTESRLELDVYEGYNSDPDGHHQAYHNWPAARVIDGRIAQHRSVGNYTGLTASKMGQAVNLFDNEYHIYGMMVDESWIKFYFDNEELARFATPVEARQDLFILVDLALLPHQADKAEGVYEFVIDYIRVYQERQE